MGTGIRNFIFADSGEIVKISQLRLDRIEQRKEAAPEYAARRMKIGTIIVKTEERRPISVVNASWWVMYIDRNGFFDEKKEREGMRLALNLVHLNLEENHGPVLDITRKLDKQRYENEHCWTPTDEELARLRMLLGKTLGMQCG